MTERLDKGVPGGTIAYRRITLDELRTIKGCSYLWPHALWEQQSRIYMAIGADEVVRAPADAELVFCTSQEELRVQLGIPDVPADCSYLYSVSGAPTSQLQSCVLVRPAPVWNVGWGPDAADIQAVQQWLAADHRRVIVCSEAEPLFRNIGDLRRYSRKQQRDGRSMAFAQHYVMYKQDTTWFIKCCPDEAQQLLKRKEKAEDSYSKAVDTQIRNIDQSRWKPNLGEMTYLVEALLEDLNTQIRSTMATYCAGALNLTLSSDPLAYTEYRTGSAVTIRHADEICQALTAAVNIWPMFFKDRRYRKLPAFRALLRRAREGRYRQAILGRDWSPEKSNVKVQKEGYAPYVEEHANQLVKMLERELRIARFKIESVLPAPIATASVSITELPPIVPKAVPVSEYERDHLQRDVLDVRAEAVTTT